MPTRAPRICAHCARVVAFGTTCPCRTAHEASRRAEYDKSRPTSAQRGYGADWRRVRDEVLAEHPQCATPGCHARAVEVHHLRSVRKYPHLRLEKSNLSPLCKRCHSSTTAIEQGWAGNNRDGGRV